MDGKQQEGKAGSPAGSGTPKSGLQSKMPPRRMWLWFLAILAINYLVTTLIAPGPEAPVTIPYTLFLEEVQKDNVQSIHSRGDAVTGRFKAPVTYPQAVEKSTIPRRGFLSLAYEGAGKETSRRKCGGWHFALGEGSDQLPGNSVSTGPWTPSTWSAISICSTGCWRQRAAMISFNGAPTS